MGRRIQRWLQENFDREVHHFPGASTVVVYKPKQTDPPSASVRTPPASPPPRSFPTLVANSRDLPGALEHPVR